MRLENQVLVWDGPNNVAGLKQLMAPQLSPLDNWISNDNTYIKKRLKSCTFLFPPFIAIYASSMSIFPVVRFFIAVYIFSMLFFPVNGNFMYLYQ